MKIRESCDFELASQNMFQSPTLVNLGKNRVAELLDVEVVPATNGLQVVRIGERSPLCRLKPLGSHTMHGLVERNDRIVAIDGVLLQCEKDLNNLIDNRPSCEITIFDHRTRLTVSWQVHVRELLESA